METNRAGIRGRREGWADGIKIVLQERDFDILFMIWVCGVLRSRDIQRLRFGSRGTTTDRLRKLYCAGFLECLTRDLTGDNYYLLTSRGRDALVEARDLEPDAYRLVRKLPGKLDHMLAITELRIHLQLACDANGTYALDTFQTDTDLAAARHAALLDLIPDAKVAIRDRATGDAHPLFLELDLGTEALTWLVRHKLAVYARHAIIGTALYGVRNPLVILVVPGLRRARNIARALVAASLQPRLVLALRGELSEGNVLGAAYATPSDLLAAATDADALRAFGRRLLP